MFCQDGISNASRGQGGHFGWIRGMTRSITPELPQYYPRKTTSNRLVRNTKSSWQFAEGRASHVPSRMKYHDAEFGSQTAEKARKLRKVDGITPLQLVLACYEPFPPGTVSQGSLSLSLCSVILSRLTPARPLTAQTNHVLDPINNTGHLSPICKISI